MTLPLLFVSLAARCEPAVDPSAPRAADPSEPQAIDPAAPRAVDPSAPRPVDPSAPRAVDRSPPRAVDPSAPRAVEPGVACPEPTPHRVQTDDDRRRAQKIADSPFRRRGFVLGLGVGVSGCSGGGDWCAGRNWFAPGVPDLAGTITGAFAKESKVGPSFMVEAGYRARRIVTPTVFFEIAHRPQQVNVPLGTRVGPTRAFSLSAGAAAHVHPLRHSRFDPFVGLGLGMAHHSAHIELTSDEQIRRSFDERLTRALVRISAGLDIFVVPRLAIGPRFDYDFFAGGRRCEAIARTDPGAATTSTRSCQSAAELARLDRVEGGKGPAGQLLQFWRLMLGSRVYF